MFGLAGTGQERAGAPDCPGNAATFKSSRISWDRSKRILGRVGALPVIRLGSA